MPAFTAKMSSFLFDEDKFLKATDKAIMVLLKAAAGKFLHAALDRIPVHTGFVAGAFKPLAIAIGETTANSAITRLLRKYGQSLRKEAYLREQLEFARGKKEVGQLVNEATAQEAKHSKNLRRLQAKLITTKPKGRMRKAFEREIKEARAALQATRDLITKHGGEAKMKEESLARLERRIGSLERKLSTRERLSQRLHGQIKEKKVEATLVGLRHKLRRNHEVDIERPHFFKNAREAGLHLGKFRREHRKTSKGENTTQPLEYYTHYDGSKTIKTPTSGQNFATDKPITYYNGVYNFDFEVDIVYFNINDENSNPHTPSAPWRAIANGRRAFLEHMEQHMEELPDVLSFMYETTWTLGKNGSMTKATKKLVLIYSDLL